MEIYPLCAAVHRSIGRRAGGYAGLLAASARLGVAGKLWCAACFAFIRTVAAGASVGTLTWMMPGAISFSACIALRAFRCSVLPWHCKLKFFGEPVI